MLTAASITPSCENPYKSAMAGAVVALTGLDRLLPLPPVIHHAVAGILVDYYCGAAVGMNSEAAYSALYGVGGATIASVARG